MRLAKLSVPALVTAAMIAVAAPAHADPDADFATQLHGYGIYGPHDYNAWLGKITCERLHNGLDTTADKSAHFALINRDSFCCDSLPAICSERPRLPLLFGESVAGRRC